MLGLSVVDRGGRRARGGWPVMGARLTMRAGRRTIAAALGATLALGSLGIAPVPASGAAPAADLPAATAPTWEASAPTVAATTPSLRPASVLATADAVTVEVEVETATGRPVARARVSLEQRPSGGGPDGWQRTADAGLGWLSGTIGITGVTGTVSLLLPPLSDLEFRLLIEPYDAPAFVQPLTVTADGSLIFPATERQVRTEGSRVTVALWPTTPEDPQPEWLSHVNRARDAAGLSPLIQRGDWNRAAELHARYATTNRWFAHDEDAALTGHTVEGRWAARVGNLGAAQAPPTHLGSIVGWLNSPGHAAWILHPRGRYVGYGDHHQPDQDTHNTSTVLPIATGLLQDAAVPDRVRYPEAGRSFAVPVPVDDECTISFEGSTTRSRLRAPAVCTLHLFVPAVVAEHGPLEEGSLSASVTVDGETSPARTRTSSHAGHVGIILPRPLQPHQHVQVRVEHAGRPLDSWSFETVDLADQDPMPLPAPIEEDADPRDGDPAPQPEPDPPGVPDPDPDDTTDPAPVLPWDVVGTAHERAIAAILARGIAGGYADGTYRPGEPVTRGQMATFLARALDLTRPTDPQGTDPTDIAGTAHELAIRAVVGADIAGGFSDGTFRPGGPVSRGQMATFLARALELDLDVEPIHLPSDVAGTTHDRAIRAVIANGIAGGHADGTYRPANPVTRGQMATFLIRALALESDS
jgi:uncharacterized protein YkwD